MGRRPNSSTLNKKVLFFYYISFVNATTLRSSGARFSSGTLTWIFSMLYFCDNVCKDTGPHFLIEMLLSTLKINVGFMLANLILNTVCVSVNLNHFKPVGSGLLPAICNIQHAITLFYPHFTVYKETHLNLYHSNKGKRRSGWRHWNNSIWRGRKKRHTFQSFSTGVIML